MNLPKPIGRRVLVKLDAANDKSKGGIIIPDNAKDKPIHGTVVELGLETEPLEGGRPEVPQVLQGKRVIIKAWAGVDVEHEGETYKLVDLQDVLVMLPGTEN